MTASFLRNTADDAAAASALQHGTGLADAVTARAGSDFPIAIIGAGFAGIGTAIRLKQAGIDSFTIFERASEVGGTWRDNTYPGAACDVPSHVYSLSFEPNPNWSRRFAESHEIQAYLIALVDKWKLRSHIRFGTAIESADFDEGAGTWTLATSAGDAFTARVVVSCVGGLVDPKFPEIPGIGDFAGKVIHTARWDHAYDLTGKRVAVIGTGASAVQVVPSIAAKVAKLTVFQRTPGWVLPKMDKAYSSQERGRFARFPLALRLSRAAKYWFSEVFGPIVFLDSERLARVGRRWSLAHLEKQVKDPGLRARLTPTFQFGCKRILISDDYWATFERDNVELVTDRIDKLTAAGITTGDGTQRELDAIVFATGFDLSITKAPFAIRGRGGKRLDDAWKEGAVAYKGLAVSGFPNWFILMGPNTGPGHTSVLVYTEAQIAHVLGAIREMKGRNLRAVSVRRDVQDRYNRRIQGRMKHMVWGTGCTSWYLAKDGGNHSLFPGFAAEYVARTRRFKPADYEISGFEAA